MAFDLNRFYRQLDEHYAAHDNAATEQFLKSSRSQAYQEGLADPLPAGCPSCAPSPEPNMAYVSVCNEMACFYRGLSRFRDSLDAFTLAQEELESLYLQNTVEYATILLNKAGTYRYMGDTDQALEHFSRSARILETDRKGTPQVLAGLYNNMGLVYLDKKQPQEALEHFLRALPLVSAGPDRTVEQGTTWNNLAAAYRALGQQTQAEDAVGRAVDILSLLDEGVNPHYPAALNTRGTFAYEAGRYQQALEDFLEALEKTRLVYGENAEYAYGCSNCAAACEKLGRMEEAGEWRKKYREVQQQIHCLHKDKTCAFQP